MTDSHAHLDAPEFDADRDDVLRNARAAGVGRIVSIGMLDERESWERAFGLVDRLHPDGEDHGDPELPELWTTVGCHPHDASRFDETGGEEALSRRADRARLLAIGEVGLDYHYDLSPRPQQRDAFRRQIRVARELGLPVVVHHRDAEDDFLRIADEEGLADAGAIMHCFTATRRLADAAVERGFLISFSGILTFRNAGDLREIAAAVSVERLLVETDCPYLTPAPFRGRRNEPMRVVETARVLAAATGLAPDELEAATDANFSRFFGLLDGPNGSPRR